MARTPNERVGTGKAATMAGQPVPANGYRTREHDQLTSLDRWGRGQSSKAYLGTPLEAIHVDCGSWRGREEEEADNKNFRGTYYRRHATTSKPDYSRHWPLA